MIDLDRYFARIGHAGPIRPDEETLRALHLAHAEAIPFENLDIHLGIPLSSDPARLFDKMVVHRRGGYCFEQNGLFAAALERCGFTLRPLLGRTTWGAPVPRPRGHLLTLVMIGDRRFVADVGFGGHGLLEPLPFEPGGPLRAGGETYRFRPSATGFELELRQDGDWKSMYWFDEAPCYPVDVDIMNHYHATCPDSFFYQTRTVALARRDQRLTLTHGELKIMSRTGVETRPITDGAGYVAALRDLFGIELPAGRSLRPAPFEAAQHAA